MQKRPRALALVLATTTAVASVGAFAWFGGDDSPNTTVALRPPAAAVVTAARAEVADGILLGTDPAGTIRLDAPAPGHDSALLRISVVAPTDAKDAADAKDAVSRTVLADGAPALVLDAHESGSTSVLVPVVDGAVRLSASVPTTVAIEPLVFFQSDTDAPGSTVALAAPVTRADTASGLAGTALGAEPTAVGVTGLGGVPATGVRAVYVTAVVDVPAATQVRIAGQEHAVPSGATAITTVVVPTSDGTVPVSLESGAGTLRLDVRGWVPEAAIDHAAVNVAGSYLPAVGGHRTDLRLTEAPSAAIDLAASADSRYALAVVGSGPATATTTLSLGEDGAGDTAGGGIVVDGSVGALPQIAVVPADGPAPRAHVASGTADATVLPLGTILGDPAPAAEDVVPVVRIVSPAVGSSVDLGDGGLVRLTGTVDAPGAAVESVRVSVDGETVAAAVVRPGADGWTWSAQTSAPASGRYEFDVEVTTRDGATGGSRVAVDVAVPDATELVVADSLRVVGDDVPAQSLTTVDDERLVFASDPGLAPGQVVAAAASDQAPRGLLRHVEAVDRTAAGWVVSTAPAAITDVVLQADEDVDVAIDPAGAVVEPLPADGSATEGSTPAAGVAVVDEGVVPVELTDEPMPVPGPAGADSAPADDTPPSPEGGTPTPGDSPPTPGDSPPTPGDSPSDAPVPAPTPTTTTGSGGTPSPEASSDAASGGAPGTAPRAGIATVAAPGALGADVSPAVGITMNGLTVWEPGKGAQDLSRADAATRAAALEAVQASGGASLATSAHAEVSVRFVLKVGLAWRWGLPLPEVTEHRLAVGHELAAEIVADTYAGTPVTGEVSVPAARVRIPATVIPIGPVPLVVSATLDIDLLSAMTVDAEGHLAANARVAGTYGYEYTSAGGWRTLDDDPEIAYGPPDASFGTEAAATGSAEASAGARVRVEVWLYETLGAAVTVSAMPGVGATVAETGGPVTTHLFADVAGSGSVALKVPVLGLALKPWTLVELDARIPVARFTIPRGGAPVEEADPEA